MCCERQLEWERELRHSIMSLWRGALHLPIQSPYPFIRACFDVVPMFEQQPLPGMPSSRSFKVKAGYL